MRVTASNSYEGLIAAAIEPYTAHHDGVSTTSCESRLSGFGWVGDGLNKEHRKWFKGVSSQEGTTFKKGKKEFHSKIVDRFKE